MSEQKLISPLLDGFSMGNPMSEHDGVRCCPAIKENTDKKFIVKIITIPASQVQLDALLLAGAYKDPADAMEYYRQIGEGILKEAELLKTLSKLDGFLPYEGWQMEPITRRRLGYEVYLVGSYKRTLDKYVKQHPVTQLEAINLGLDLCAALTVCRQAGALYADLKPSNIFVSEKKEYRIGDLGFIQLDALNYTALPDKYYSAYTPPELFDPMASLNMTVDTYAVGMILYQLYNDGQLPFQGLRNPEITLPTPIHADYELAEIIMKAIHVDSAERWTDPADLGKALAAYMQRNTINDVPITPHIPLDVDPADIVPIEKKKKNQQSEPEESPNPEISEPEQPLPVEEIPAAEEIPMPESEEAEVAEEVEESETTSSPEPEETEDALPPPEESESTKEPESTVPEEHISEEVSHILSKADDLIAHEPEAGVMMPPTPVALDPFAFATEDDQYADEAGIPSDPVMDDEDEVPVKKATGRKKKEKSFQDPKYKRRRKRFFSFVITLLVLCLIGLGGFWYYQNLYLISIANLTLAGSQDQITVTVDDAPNGLRVTCSDPYGMNYSKPLTDGQAVFSDLKPNTLYTVKLEIDGFHSLIGKTSDVFTTEATTTIVSFTSIAGAEDGSVILSFTVDGEEPNDWTVIYSTEGEMEKRQTFTGHTVTVSGLSVGKVYTFTLETGENMALGGQISLELLATRLILAEDMTITSDNGTDITVHWKAPGDVVVDSWEVRCHNDIGYEETVTVSDTQVTFTGIDPTASYTVEVTAAGMTQSARTGITADPIRISSIQVDDSSHKKLTVTWNHSGKAPKDGWLLIYNLAGGQKNVVKCTKASAVIPDKIPGTKYNLVIQAADGTSIFNNTGSYTCPEAAPFNKHHLTTDMLDVQLAKVPDAEEWYAETLDASAFTDTFAPGEKVAVILQSSGTFYMTGAQVDIQYVIRDAYGNVLPDFVAKESPYWKNIWSSGDAKNGELVIPQLPTAPGDYVLTLYFDGMEVTELPFTIQ